MNLWKKSNGQENSTTNGLKHRYHRSGLISEVKERLRTYANPWKVERLKVSVTNGAYYVCSMRGNTRFAQCGKCSGDKYWEVIVNCTGYPDMEDHMAIRVPVYAIEHLTWRQYRKMETRLKALEKDNLID